MDGQSNNEYLYGKVVGCIMGKNRCIFPSVPSGAMCGVKVCCVAGFLLLSLHAFGG